MSYLLYSSTHRPSPPLIPSSHGGIGRGGSFDVCRHLTFASVSASPPVAPPHPGRQRPGGVLRRLPTLDFPPRQPPAVHPLAKQEVFLGHRLQLFPGKHPRHERGNRLVERLRPPTRTREEQAPV